MVHENHGVGIYQGIEKIESDKIAKDYMKISYAAGGNLYIPATQLDLIQKYASADARNAKAEPSWHAGLDQNEKTRQKCGTINRKRSGEVVCGKTGAGRFCIWRGYRMAAGI